MSAVATGRSASTAADEGSGPERQGLVLATLILVAAVANLNLSVANVALPSIGDAFDSSQTQLDLVAVGYSLGLAGSVLYFGALGDRYGRKLMVILGMSLTIPASLMAALAPSMGVLFAGRVFGGLAAGMAFPTTLALITALWSGPQRTRSIALWSGIGGAIAALGPAISGGLLEIADWGWVFAVTIPLALIALLLAIRMIPAHVNENVKPVDNLGGALSMVVVVSVVLAINFLPVPNKTTLALALAGVALLGLAGFVIRQRRASNPLYDLRVASRPTFWVAAVAGVIVFGTLMGVAFIGQQYLQNVLDYSTLDAGLAILPAVVFMVLVAPRSAKIVDARGARLTLLLGYSFLFTAFVLMLLLWKEGTPYWQVALAFALVGIGIGLAGTPASHSLTGSVPVRRVGMASGTADLQRDLGGAIMQSILGALLTGGYASAASSAIAASPQSSQVSDNVQGELTKSFAGAEEIANQYPQYSESIIAAAKSAFLKGDELAYIVGGIAILLGAILVFFVFPKKAQEERLLSEYSAEDAGGGDPPGDQE